MRLVDRLGRAIPDLRISIAAAKVVGVSQTSPPRETQPSLNAMRAAQRLNPSSVHMMTVRQQIDGARPL